MGEGERARERRPQRSSEGSGKRQHTSAYVGIRVSIRQHTSAYLTEAARAAARAMHDVDRKAQGALTGNITCPPHYQAWRDSQNSNETNAQKRARYLLLYPAAVGAERGVGKRSLGVLKYRCPECDEPFQKWTTCLEHLKTTGHANPGNKQGLQQRCRSGSTAVSGGQEEAEDKDKSRRFGQEPTKTSALVP